MFVFFEMSMILCLGFCCISLSVVLMIWWLGILWMSLDVNWLLRVLLRMIWIDLYLGLRLVLVGESKLFVNLLRLCRILWVWKLMLLCFFLNWLSFFNMVIGIVILCLWNEWIDFVLCKKIFVFRINSFCLVFVLVMRFSFVWSVVFLMFIVLVVWKSLC